MLIHIEGVDLCGKTTLIDKMTKLFRNTMVLSVPKEYIPKKDNPKQREKMWKHFLERAREVEKLLDDNPDCNIILDRFFITELVYGKIMRGYDSKDMLDYQTEVINILSRIEKKHGYAMIYLSDKTESIWKRFLDKGDDYVKDKKHYHNLKVEFGKVINSWERVFKVIKINVFEDKDYWNKIIEDILLSNYQYKRNG